MEPRLLPFPALLATIVAVGVLVAVLAVLAAAETSSSSYLDLLSLFHLWTLHRPVSNVLWTAFRPC